jgi:hypothetical protein
MLAAFAAVADSNSQGNTGGDASSRSPNPKKMKKAKKLRRWHPLCNAQGKVGGLGELSIIIDTSAMTVVMPGVVNRNEGGDEHDPSQRVASALAKKRGVGVGIGIGIGSAGGGSAVGV